MKKPVWKISSTVPGDRVEFVRARLNAFGGSLSAYVHYLVEQDYTASRAERGAAERHRDRVVEALPEQARMLGPRGLAGKWRRTGWYPAAEYSQGRLVQEVAEMAAAAAEHKLERLVVVVPDDAPEEDLVNWSRIRSVGVAPVLEVMRIREIPQK